MDAVTPPEAPQTRRSRFALLVGLLGLAALAMAIFIGTRVLGVLYGIVSPPLPPVPPAAEEVSYTSIGYGVDEWVYNVELPPCELVAFYEAQGGTCRILPYQCGSMFAPEDTNPLDEMVARCGGSIRFSIFVMDWRVFLSERGDGAKVELSREVNWIGTEPRPLPDETDEPG
jgi:hypothetical protein